MKGGLFQILKLAKKYYFLSLPLIKNNSISFKNFIYDLPQWILYNISKKDSIENGIPWLTFQATRYIKSRLSKDKNVFEYGSGGSSIFFIHNGCKVSTVEHNKIWFEKVNEKLNNTKWNGSLVEPELIEFSTRGDLINDRHCYDQDSIFDPTLYFSNNMDYSNYSFEKYVKEIDRYPDDFFDIILIDGRARYSCWQHSINKLKIGGMLVLDNSERNNYFPIKKEVETLNWKKYTFFGAGPYSTNFWETTIWERR